MIKQNLGLSGAPTRTRTADLLITNQLLYQLSYRGIKRADNDIYSRLQDLKDNLIGCDASFCKCRHARVARDRCAQDRNRYGAAGGFTQTHVQRQER